MPARIVMDAAILERWQRLCRADCTSLVRQFLAFLRHGARLQIKRVRVVQQ